MSDPAKVTCSIADLCCIKITRKKLCKPVGFESKSPRRDVPYTDGIQWWLSMHPNGEIEDNEDFIDARFNVTGAVNVHVTMAIQGTDIKKTLCAQNVLSFIRFPRLADHDDLWQKSFETGLTLVCKVKFDLDLRPKGLKNSLFLSCDHVDTDFEFIIGDSSVKVHRQLLTLVSPVFQAMFSHDTVEARTGKLTIKDLDYDAVKSAIDFIYGRELTDHSMEEVIGILRFGDKYDIKSIMVEFEKILLFNFSHKNYCLVAHYAFDCSRTAIMDKCGRLFHASPYELGSTAEFRSLPPRVIIALLKNAFSLNEVIPLIKLADAFGIPAVSEYYAHFLNTLSLENFVEITNYAWHSSKTDLKQKCAEFLDEHRVEVTTMEAFYTLPPTTVQEVMKMAMEIKKISAKA